MTENQNWKKTVSKNEKKVTNPIGVSKFKIIRALKNLPNQIQFKTSFESNYEILTTRKCKSDANVIKYRLTKAYESVQGLPNVKLKDLLTLCKSNIIPPAYHHYYESFSEKLKNDTQSADLADEKENED